MTEQGKRIRRIALMVGGFIALIIIFALIGPTLFNFLLEMHGLA